MVDIHSHVLTGIDDGAQNIETSLEMLKIAYSEGIDKIIATPHYIPGVIENTKDIVLKKCDALNALAEKENINIKIYPGTEIFISLETPEFLEQGRICSLNGSRYILVEFPMGSLPIFCEEVLFNVRLLGYVPIIAHPERNQAIIENPEIFRKFVKEGCLSQMNSTSITGIHGKQVMKTAFWLIENGLVHFVSSDAHTVRSRAPRVNAAKDIISKEFGIRLTNSLFDVNPLKVLEDMEIDADLVKGFKRVSWINRILGR